MACQRYISQTFLSDRFLSRSSLPHGNSQQVYNCKPYAAPLHYVKKCKYFVNMDILTINIAYAPQKSYMFISLTHVVFVLFVVIIDIVNTASAWTKSGLIFKSKISEIIFSRKFCSMYLKI